MEKPTKTQEFVSWLEGKAQAANETMEKFKSRINDNPAYAFEWGDSAIEAAAWLEQTKRFTQAILNAGLDNEFNFEHALEVLKRDLRTSTRYVQRSTCQSDNLLSQYRRAVLCAIVEYMEGVR